MPPCTLSPGILLAGDEGSEDYQNSASIQQWRESRRVTGTWLESRGSWGQLRQVQRGLAWEDRGQEVMGSGLGGPGQGGLLCSQAS